MCHQVFDPGKVSRSCLFTEGEILNQEHLVSEEKVWQINAKGTNICGGSWFKYRLSTYTAAPREADVVRSILQKHSPNSPCSLIWELSIPQVEEGFLSADGCNSTDTPPTLLTYLCLFSLLFPLLSRAHTWKLKAQLCSAGRAPVSLASVGLLSPDPDCKKMIDARRCHTLCSLSVRISTDW